MWRPEFWLVHFDRCGRANSTDEDSVLERRKMYDSWQWHHSHIDDVIKSQIFILQVKDSGIT